jgi:hypothetical protein
MKLLTGSISTFCVLGRHALLLSGRDPHWKKREILVALTAALNHPFLGASAILSIRAAGKTLPDQNPVSIFEQYLDETDALVRFVDALDR